MWTQYDFPLIDIFFDIVISVLQLYRFTLSHFYAIVNDMAFLILVSMCSLL